MLKAVPNKNAGFIILFTSIFILFYFMRSLSISFYFIIFFTNRFNGFYLCFWFLLILSFIWIGGQFPVDNFLSYGRILTLHYYYLLICILFSRSDVVHSVHSSGSPRSLILTNEGPKDRSEVGWVVNERNEREWTTRRTEHGKHRQLDPVRLPTSSTLPFSHLLTRRRRERGWA